MKRYIVTMLMTLAAVQAFAPKPLSMVAPEYVTDRLTFRHLFLNLHEAENRLREN